jgi:hypothetical protein
MVTPDTLSTQEQHVQESITRFWEKGRKCPVWYLEAHGISHIRTDGQPYRQTDIISLQDKNGKWLGKKQTPDMLATQFRGLGVTASWLHHEAPNFAVGRIFHFVEYTKDEGKRWAKTITLFPREIMPADYKFEGEVITVTPSSNDNGAVPSAVTQVPHAQVVTYLQNALAGKTPTEMFDAIMASPELKSVGKVFGVDLLTSATDDSLANVLAENKVLELDAEGKFKVPA